MQTNNIVLRAKFVFTDVTSWKSQVEAFKTAIASSPSKSLDTVVAAAGIAGTNVDTTTSANGNEDDPPEPATLCIKVNLFGVYYTNQLAIHYMGRKSNDTDDIGKIFGGTAVRSDKDKLDGNPKSIILVGSLAGYHSIPVSEQPLPVLKTLLSSGKTPRMITSC